jgi:hypothetical protein
MRLHFIAILVLITGATALSGQDTTNTTFGKGLINLVAKDSTWVTKTTFRIQTRYEGVFINDDALENAYTDRFRVRRARIKGSGWATKSQRLKYKFEYDVQNGFVLDAVVKWVFDKNRNWELWFGQTKLPGNMERVISSQAMVFVDRSLLNARFTLDRDAGIQLHGKQKLGDNFEVKEKFALSQGEGLNQTGQSIGHGYTARLELFPFGAFKDAYVGSDFKRHDKVKLMLAFTYDYNQDAVRERGQLGSYIDPTLSAKSLQTIFVDAHLKYKGFSWMTEYAQRATDDDNPIIVDLEYEGPDTPAAATYYTGTAINTQLAYLLPSNWEVAGRYTMVTPQEETGYADQTEYGIALSRYIVGHNLKVQADVNLLQVEGSDADQTLFRLQTEFTF